MFFNIGFTYTYSNLLPFHGNYHSNMAL